jgi:hypothetical protein
VDQVRYGNWSAKRISVEHRLEDSHLLVPVVDHLTDTPVQMEYHVTLLHLGRPPDLINFLGGYSSRVTANIDAVLTQLDQILRHFLPNLTAFATRPSEVAIFSTNPQGGLIVLPIPYPATLRAARTELWEAVLEWIADWAGETASNDAHTNTDLQWNPPESWSPHVTLGPALDEASVPSFVTLPDDLQFSMAQLRNGPIRRPR